MRNTKSIKETELWLLRGYRIALEEVLEVLEKLKKTIKVAGIDSVNRFISYRKLKLIIKEMHEKEFAQT